MTHDYRLFGLKIRSELELPELFLDASDADPDVTITLGRAADVTEEAGLSAEDGGLLLVVPEVARFTIAGGSLIVVEPAIDAPIRNVRLFLLGSAFGALLHQRGLLPLHANAIEVEGRAIAFMGASGAGKSTAAAWFHDHGYRVLADDVCVVRFAGLGQPLVCSGLPRLRLWRDVINATGREVADFGRSYVGASAELDKFDVPVGDHSAIQDQIRLSAIYVLKEGDPFAIEQMANIDAADAIISNTYRGCYVPLADTQREHWESSVALIRSTPVFSLVRTKSLERLDDQCRAVLAHAASLVP